MNHLKAFELPVNDQRASPLFTVLPSEIREAICKEALCPYQDESQMYDPDTAYARPGYMGSFKCDYSLLQTCQRIYSEAWFRPWVSSIHTFWLAWNGRRPGDEDVLDPETFQLALKSIYESKGEILLSHVRVFSQLCNIDGLGPILEMPHFYPRTLTITIRHHDWWNWEDDARLYIDEDVCMSFQRMFPASLAEIRMELESLQRKREQIDYVANEMIQRWWFLRSDGVVMQAQAKDFESYEWSGSSTWEDARWIRDETKPETNEYYVKTVVWKPNQNVLEEDLEEPEMIEVPDTFPEIHVARPSVRLWDLHDAGIPAGTPAQEVESLINFLHALPDPGSDDDL